ncbi:MAG: triose-phosphate isomerase [Thermoanaerobaculia bacterium]
MRHLVANWKMNLPKEGIPLYLESLQARPDWQGVEVSLAVPAPLLVPLRDRLAGAARLGAQNVSEHPSGAFTGEVSVAMLAEAGAEFVLVGHSERRALFGETDELVARKAVAVLASPLELLLCVGEDLETREAGRTVELLEGQLTAVFSAVKSLPDRMLIAYEPVWAIGTGKNATPQMAADTHRQIREIVARLSTGKTTPVILYGGSVKPSNAAELAAESEIEGFLVGGASLQAKDFLAIGGALEERG